MKGFFIGKDSSMRGLVPRSHPLKLVTAVLMHKGSYARKAKGENSLRTTENIL